MTHQTIKSSQSPTPRSTAQLQTTSSLPEAAEAESGRKPRRSPTPPAQPQSGGVIEGALPVPPSSSAKRPRSAMKTPSQQRNYRRKKAKMGPHLPPPGKPDSPREQEVKEEDNDDDDFDSDSDSNSDPNSHDDDNDDYNDYDEDMAGAVEMVRGMFNVRNVSIGTLNIYNIKY
jgi:hypothetical protein